MDIIKKIGILGLCGLLTLRVMIAPIIYIEYEFNKAYIIKNFCINKNRPQLHCDGKCYLAKRIKAAEERENHESKIGAIKQLLELYHCKYDYFTLQITKVISTQTLNFAYLNNYVLSPISSILKPPQL